MSFSATYYGSSGWLLDFGGYRVLIDPWLKGSLSFPPGPWLIEGKLTREQKPPDEINLILLTQGLADHCHPPSLEILSKSIPVIGSLSAAKVVRDLGFKFVIALEPGEQSKCNDLNIIASAGASVPTVQNGYLLKHYLGSVYIEPHGFLDKRIKQTKLDAVITPVVNLQLPLAGSFIQGKNVLPKLIQIFNPLTVLASTTGGDIEFNGLLNRFISIEGDIEEASERLGDEILLIEPMPGKTYNLKTHSKSNY